MLSRRQMIFSVMSSTALRNLWQAQDQTSVDQDNTFDQLIYPPFEALNNPKPFGYNPPTESQKQEAEQIIEATVKGPKPIDIAQSFVDRFYTKKPRLISQWPAPESWNPLIVQFFRATARPANNDMIPWCAAFVNWCIERSGKHGSRSASSQSFLSKYFKSVSVPQPGDLAIFTCFDNDSNKDLGIGHVAFVRERISETRIRIVGGNQSKDGHSSIICEEEFVTTDRDVRRHIGNKYVHCTLRLNSYVSIV
jgi:uncharacterized protein (TIGR02594 family)